MNHPHIYRRLLSEMGADVPPTASPEFVRWPGFREESFELPVFWLSLGQLCGSRTPEILGLNLAMELSGVGGSYRRAGATLKHHGFSALFVELHNTIDNVSSGHSAWAADAIDAYMLWLAGEAGTGELAQVWERIRVGYRALNPPARRRSRWLRHRQASSDLQAQHPGGPHA